MDDSSWHEELVKEWIRKSAFQIHSEQMTIKCGRINGKDILGRMDGIFTDILGIDRILEIKALSHFGFQEIWAGHLPLDYITQTCLYLKGIKEINPDIKDALLFIKNKNQSQYLEILLSLDETDHCLLYEMTLSTGEKKQIKNSIENITKSAIEKFEEVDRFKKEKIIHPRQYERNSWRCEYCAYGELCWEGWEEEIENMVEGTADEEFETLCRYYKETAAHETEMKKEKEVLNKQIKDYMKNHSFNKITAGEYTAILRVQSKTTINEEKIPPAILEQAKEPISFEVLNVNKKKGAKP